MNDRQCIMPVWVYRQYIANERIYGSSHWTSVACRRIWSEPRLWVRWLAAVGFITFVVQHLPGRQSQRIQWPFRAPRAVSLRHWWNWYVWHNPTLYVFRNRANISRIPGRLLPVRWGFGIAGFEFGDRG